MPKFTFSFSTLLLFASCLCANGDVVITATEVNGNTLFSAEGTLDLSALNPLGGGSATANLDPDRAVIAVGANPNDFISADFYSGLTNTPTSFGDGNFTGGTRLDGSGDRFGVGRAFDGNQSFFLIVPQNFTGGSISGTLVHEGDFETLGIVPGSYLWEWGSGTNADSITLNIVAIPEPSSTAMIAMFGYAAIAVRRREKTTQLKRHVIRRS